MIRDFTKSAISLSWALSLLGLKQTVNLFRPGQQGGNLFEPMVRAAVDQLDDSMKNIYRSGESLNSRAMDLAFSWVNPVNWVNPGNWTRPFNGNCGQRQSGQGAASYSQNNNFTSSSQTQAGSTGTYQNVSNTVPVNNETPAGGWGPMPVDS